MLIACLGDLLLDVVVDSADVLVPDDDSDARVTLAPGGQAANVAAWAAQYGADVRLFSPRCADLTGRLAEEPLVSRGVELVGPRVARMGTALSLTGGGRRTLATDPGDLRWLEQVAPGPWLAKADWLFVSGYALLRSTSPERLVACAEAAHAAGTRVAVDLASASMLTGYGARAFRALWRSLRPQVVLANEDEWRATHADDPSGTPTPDIIDRFGAGGRSVLVLKQGARGCGFVIDGAEDHRAPRPGPVVDATGAGDALTAGFLVGGVDLAMAAAARCVAVRGAQPDDRPEDRPVNESDDQSGPGGDA